MVPTETAADHFHFDPITGPAQTFRRVFGVDSYFEALHGMAIPSCLDCLAD